MIAKINTGPDGTKYLHFYCPGCEEYESNQIKLATGENTTFDFNNPDIRYQEGGSFHVSPTEVDFMGIKFMNTFGVSEDDFSKAIFSYLHSKSLLEKDNIVGKKALSELQTSLGDKYNPLLEYIKAMFKEKHIYETGGNVGITAEDMLMQAATKKKLNDLGDQKEIDDWVERFHAKTKNYEPDTYYRGSDDIRYAQGGMTDAQPDTRSFMEKVEDSLRQAQAKKAFKDSDIRIGGAKKEMAAIRKLTRVGVDGKTISGIDLDALSAQEKEYGEVTMIKFVKKDQVFPKFDVQAQMEDGVSSGAAFLKMKLRESFPNEPKIKTEVSRRVYVGFANLLYDSFLKAKTVAEVKEMQERIASAVKQDFTKFVLGEGDVYLEATRAVLEMIGDESNPPKTEFKDFEEAYDYLNAYAQVAFSKYRALRELTLERLNKDFGLVPYKIADGLSNASDERIRDFADQWCIDNYHGKEAQLYHFIKHYFDLNGKMMILAGGDISSYHGNVANHLFTIALRKIPLVDKHKRPLRDKVEPYELIASLFTTGFANFIMQLGSYYSGAQKENYEAALAYEAVSPEQSAQQIAKFKAANEDNITHEQDMLTAIMKAKTVDEVDALYKANKIHSYGFYMTFRSQSGRSKTDHAFWDKLTDNADKWAWVTKYIQSGEKRIREWNERMDKFIETHQPHPDDWAWAADILGDKPTDPVTGLPVDAPKRKAHSNTPLDYIERFGGLRIDKSKLNDQEDIRRYMHDTFGFRAFELGASLKDEEAKEIIYHFLGAISDFGDILNFDFAELNRRMGLSMGFATRGSGSANAHYESLGRIINLTKSRGDGSVAHELGHYLDNVIPALDHISSYNYAQFATYEKENKGYQPGNIQNPAVKMAMLEIMAFILYGKKKTQRFNIRQQPMEPGFDTGKGSYLDYVAKAENAGNRRLRTAVFFKELDELPEIYARMYGRYVYYENCSRTDLLVYDIAVKEAGLTEHTFRIRSKMSLYYTNSSRTGGDYWVRPTELFARAFEVYVADKLKAAGRANNFLCHGEYSDDVDEYSPNYPYPQFEERKYLFGLFDNLFVQLKQAYNLGDFVPFTTERNEHTREELALSSKELVKLRQNYEKRLRVLQSILTTDVKRIKLDNGYIVSYKPDEKYAMKRHPEYVFTLKSITPKLVTLTDIITGKELLLSDEAFVADYQNAGQIFAAGGKFVEALKSEPENEFYKRFLTAHELYDALAKESPFFQIGDEFCFSRQAK